MTIWTAISIGLFLGMQGIAQLFFKWGSNAEDRWWWGFLIGNFFGFTSIGLLMQVYKAMNPNMALGICVGGSFLLSQLALSIVFKSPLSTVQWGGVGVIFLGMLLLAGGKSWAAS